jgi:hypothetical protein
MGMGFGTDKSLEVALRSCSCHVSSHSNYPVLVWNFLYKLCMLLMIAPEVCECFIVLLICPVIKGNICPLTDTC